MSPPAERGESFSKTSQRSSFGCACPTDSRRVMATRAPIRHGIGAKRNPILGRILPADISNGVVDVCSPKVAQRLPTNLVHGVTGMCVLTAKGHVSG